MAAAASVALLGGPPRGGVGGKAEAAWLLGLGRASCRMRARCWLLLALLVATPPAAGLELLDDDAGSGGDAGNLAGLAQPVTPGKYTGRLSGEADEEDWYAIDADKGDVLRLRLDARIGVVAELHGPRTILRDIYGFSVQDYPFNFVVPESGRWYVNVRFVSGLGDQAPYAFDVRLGAAGTQFLAESSGAWQTLEMTFDGSQTDWVSVYTRLRVPVGVGDPAEAMAAIELRRDAPQGEWRDHFLMGAYTQGLGHDVVVVPADVSFPVPIQIVTSVDGAGVSVLIISIPPGQRGSLKATTLHSPETPMPLLSVFADEAWPLAHTNGADLVRWLRADDALVVLPGLVASPATERLLHAEGHVVGLATRGAVVTDPAGVAENHVRTPFIFAGLSPGTWRFDYPAALEAGAAERSLLTVAKVPTLGLHR